MKTKDEKSSGKAEGGFIAFVAELILVVFLMYYSIARAILNYFLPYKKYKNINNEVVLITGGGRGLGRVLAVEFAKFNPKHIVLWGRHEDTLCATTKAVRVHGVPCSYMVCDVSDPKQVMEQAKQLVEEVGDVSILVNNAGLVNGKTVINSSTEEINETISVNTLAQFWTVKAFLPAMLRNNHGHIVSMNSTLGMMGLGSAADYCASKFACRGLSESLLLEVLREGKTGIHITDIHPGQTNTDMFAGLTHRFSDWFPPLDKEYVAAKTVRSVLLNKREVIMPRIMHVFMFFKSVLPVEALVQIYKFLGMDKAMDGFHGRKKDS